MPHGICLITTPRTRPGTATRDRTATISNVIRMLTALERVGSASLEPRSASAGGWRAAAELTSSEVKRSLLLRRGASDGRGAF